MRSPHRLLIALLGLALGLGLRWAMVASQTRANAQEAAATKVDKASPRHALEASHQTPAELFQWAASLTSSQLDQDVDSEAFKRWVQADPAAALKYAQAIADEDLRGRAVERVMKELAEFDLDQAKALLPTITSKSAQLKAATGMFPLWIQSDRTSAGKYALGFQTYHLEHKTMINLLLENDARSTIGFIQALPPGPFRNDLGLVVVEALAKRDPLGTANFAIRNQLYDTLSSPLRLSIRSLLQQDFHAATDWLKALPEGKAKEMSTIMLFLTLTDIDVAAAAEALPEFSGATAERAALAISLHQAFDDPAAATQWFDSLTDEGLRNEAVKGLVRNLADYDQKQAMQWMATLPPGAVHDTAVEIFVFRTSGKDTPLAMEWATRIGDVHRRNRALRTEGNDWMIKDAPTATRWIKTSPLLSSEMRDELLGNL